jgi:hypothetical protein
MSLWARISAWPKAHPVIFGVGVATTKTAAADLLVQKYIEKKEKLDWKRTGMFTCFGFAYLGCFQYWMYVNLFKRWFPNMATFANQTFKEKLRNRGGQKDLLKQVGFDNFIHPLWFFPMYYTLKESIQGEGYAKDFNSVVNHAMTKYKKNAAEDWTAFWKIWIAGDIFVMSIPLWARLPVNHGLSFVYVCVLSFMRGASEPTEEEKDQARKQIALIKVD